MNVLNNWKPELVYDLADKITECVKGYNDFNDEVEYFRSYLAPLIYTGELFKKLKLHFEKNKLIYGGLGLVLIVSLIAVLS